MVACYRLLHVALAMWCLFHLGFSDNVIMIDDITGEMQTFISASKISVGISNPVFVAFGSFSVILPCLPPSDVGKIDVLTFQWRVLLNKTVLARKYTTTSVNMITQELSITGRTGTISSQYYVGARYYCIVDTPYGQTVVYTYNVVAVMVPTYVLQMRVLLGNDPCDLKLEPEKTDTKSPRAFVFVSQTCHDMITSRHGWNGQSATRDSQEMMNAIVQQETAELCRATGFTLDHARDQSDAKCDRSYVLFQSMSANYKMPFNCKSLRCYFDSASASFDDNPYADYLKTMSLKMPQNSTKYAMSFDQTVVPMCNKGFRPFGNMACLPCPPGMYGKQNYDLTWDCVTCGPNGVAGRFVTDHECMLCVDGTLANEDHTACIADDQGDEALLSSYTYRYTEFVGGYTDPESIVRPEVIILAIVSALLLICLSYAIYYLHKKGYTVHMPIPTGMEDDDYDDEE